MKKHLFSLIFVCGLSFGFAQKVQYPKPETSVKPIVLLNDSVLISSETMENIHTDNIAEVRIYKQSNESSLFTAEMLTNGIIILQMNENAEDFSWVSQAELNHKFGLSEENPVYVNDLLISSKYSIHSQMAEKAFITEKDGKKVVYINL